MSNDSFQKIKKISANILFPPFFVVHIYTVPWILCSIRPHLCLCLNLPIEYIMAFLFSHCMSWLHATVEYIFAGVHLKCLFSLFCFAHTVFSKWDKMLQVFNKHFESRSPTE